jgi:nucleotide-binding universal stress UspA family protein
MAPRDAEREVLGSSDRTRAAPGGAEPERGGCGPGSSDLSPATHGDAATKPGGCVLVSSDLSRAADEAIRQGHAWAAVRGAELQAVHAVAQALPMHPLFPQYQQRDVTDLVTLERSLGERLSDRIEELTAREPGTFRVDVAFGEPYAAIVRRAEEVRASLLVVASRGMTDLELVRLGGVAEQVVRHAHCSVLVARPPAGDSVVLAATDLSDPAMPAVQAAAEEARLRGLRLVVLHDLDLWPYLGSSLALFGPVPIEPSAPTVEEARQAAQRILEGQLERLGVSGDVRVTAEGHPAAAIVRAADELAANLVVVGTRGRTGLARLALGRIAEAVIHRAHGSVLAVRHG